MATLDRPALVMEQHIALGRLALSVAAIVSVWVDPTTPNLSHWVTVQGGLFMIDQRALSVLALHLVYAVALWIADGSAAAWARAVLRVSIALDVVFGVAVAIVTEGASSPSYVFFAFAILASGCRSDFRSVLLVTGVCVAAYFGIILLSAGRGADVYLMRPVYLAIMGALLAYLAQRRLECERRTHAAESQAQRQGIARALHDGYVQALAAVNLRLGNCRLLLDRGRGDDVRTELAAIQDGVRREYDDVRGYVRALADIERRSSDLVTSEAPHCTVLAELSADSDTVEHALQIMLEGIRNARRHARATATAVAARETPGALRITIEDDGVGFGPGADVPWTVATRVRDCGGSARLSAAARGGARLEVDLPVGRSA
jgi:signal transduction histidine kinase